MNDKSDGLLKYCKNIEFGNISISGSVKKNCDDWSNEIILLCKSLPVSTQTDALLFIMKYSKIYFKGEINFLKTYYIPTWSIIYWLNQSYEGRNELTKKDINNARTAHAMAMFLHLLDDHLKDQQIPVTHLALLLRSQAWMIMNNTFKTVSDEVAGGTKVIRRFINDYYSGIRCTKMVHSIDDYCEVFKNQMATGMIIPVLLMKKQIRKEKYIQAIQAAYGAFGIAWRLLDDIKDIGEDIENGTHSSVYYSLPRENRKIWDNNITKENKRLIKDKKDILNTVIEKNIIGRIVKRLCRELNFAISIAENHNMKGWADELRDLVGPLKNIQPYP